MTAMVPLLRSSSSSNPSAGRLFLLGFADGTARCVARCADGWHLVSALKPHCVSIVALVVAPDGLAAASVALDGSVLFVGVGASGELQPRAAGKLLAGCTAAAGSVPTCATWSPAEAGAARLLVGTSAGLVVEVEVPAGVLGGGDGATAAAALQQPLVTRSYSLRLPPPNTKASMRTRQEAAQEAAAASHVATPAPAGTGAGAGPELLPPPGEQQPAVGGPLAEPGDDATPQTADGRQLRFALRARSNLDDEDDQPHLPIAWVGYPAHSSSGPSGCFMAAAAGGCWECSWEMPLPLKRIAGGGMVPGAPCFFGASTSGRFGLIGTSCGHVAVQELGPDGQPSSRWVPVGTRTACPSLPAAYSLLWPAVRGVHKALKGQSPQHSPCAQTANSPRAHRSWEATLHDHRGGRVTGLALIEGTGEPCLLSAAADGSLLLLGAPLPLPNSAGDAAVEEVPLPALEEEGQPEAADITDPHAPSLEEAAALEVASRVAAAAEGARGAMLARVAGLRAQLQALQETNGAAAPGAQLPRDAFAVDPGGRGEGAIQGLGVEAWG